MPLTCFRPFCISTLEKIPATFSITEKGKAHANITKVASRPLRRRKRQVIEEDSDAEESLGDEDTDEEGSEEEVKPRKKPQVKAKRKLRNLSKRNKTR